ncbi:MAG: hypothetical protein R3F56_21740 [Planctomycetota bacterium]
MSIAGRGAACLALLVAACRATLPREELAHLTFAPGRAERIHLEVEVQSRSLSGVFDALLVTRPSPPAVRLQLLPELGAPILDLVATPTAIGAVMQGDHAPRVWRGEPGDPSLAPPLLFGITLLEQHAPPAPARVVAGYPGPPASVDLRGLFPGTAITDAVLDGDRIASRTFRLGYVTWCDRLGRDEGQVDAPGLRLRARVLSREAADDLDDRLFQLEELQ